MQDLYDNDLYEALLGTRPVRPPAANEGGHDCERKNSERQNDERQQPFAWEAADGDGPDRLFNRYRRLRLQALAENAA